MKKLFFIVCLLAVFIACDEDNDTPTSPIQNLKMPTSTTAFVTGASVTIEGAGFNDQSQIWLRAAETKAVGDIQATVTKTTECSITFQVPENVAGEQYVILKQNGQEFTLGKLTFEKYQAKYYTFCYDEDKRELAEIDIESGQLIWTGIKIPEYDGNGRGENFDESNNEFIVFEPYPATIHKVSMDTKIKKTIILEKNKENREFNDIIKSNDNKFYSFCYNKDKNELAELDIENQKIIWTGIKVPEYNGNGRGEIFDEINNEFIVFEPYPSTIHKVNMDTKIKETIILEKDKENRNFNEIIKSNDNKFYAFCYDKDKNELAELDIENQKIIWTGIKVPEYGGNGRGEIVDDAKNELVVFDLSQAPTIYRVNMTTKNIKTMKLKNLNGARNFNNIIKRKLLTL